MLVTYHDLFKSSNEAYRSKKINRFKVSLFYLTDHEAQDPNGSSIREITEEKESPLAVNEGLVHVDTVAALCEDLHENENETEKPDKVLKTTINQSNVLGKFYLLVRNWGLLKFFCAKV